MNQSNLITEPHTVELHAVKTNDVCNTKNSSCKLTISTINLDRVVSSQVNQLFIHLSGVVDKWAPGVGWHVYMYKYIK